MTPFLESYNPNVCSFVQPEVRVKDWPVCDEMCAYSPCDDIADVIGIHFKSYLGVTEEDLPMYVHRFVFPLCYACPHSVTVSPDGTLQTTTSVSGVVTSTKVDPPIPKGAQENITYACITNPEYNASDWGGDVGKSSLGYQASSAALVSRPCN